MKTGLAVLIFATMILAGGCSGAPSGSPQGDAPRYQMQVVARDGEAYAYVYRLDTATGEIEAFLVTSPKFIEQVSREAADLLKRLHGGLTFMPGPTLPGKRN
jgi:hypothetical protein